MNIYSKICIYINALRSPLLQPSSAIAFMDLIMVFHNRVLFVFFEAAVMDRP